MRRAKALEAMGLYKQALGDVQKANKASDAPPENQVCSHPPAAFVTIKIMVAPADLKPDPHDPVIRHVVPYRMLLWESSRQCASVALTQCPGRAGQPSLGVPSLSQCSQSSGIYAFNCFGTDRTGLLGGSI